MVRRNQTAEDASPLIKWVPTDAWRDGTNADPELPRYSDSSFRLTTTKGAYASFSFNGTGVWIYGAKRGNHGPYQGTLDGSAKPQQDGFAEPGQFRAVLFSATGLEMGPHVVSLSNQMIDANRPYLDIDYIVWETEVSDQSSQVSVLEDDNSAIQYTPQGEWAKNQCPNMGSYSSGSCHISGSNTARATLSFEGDAVAVYGGVGPQYGPYAVKLDGSGPSVFTANATSHHAGQLLYFASGLGGGTHNLIINNNPATIGNSLDIDYIQVIGGGATKAGSNDVEEEDNGGGSKVGPIVGAVVGVVVLIALMGFGFFWWRRRSRGVRERRVDLDENDKSGSDIGMTANAVPTPYVVQQSNASAAFYDQPNQSHHSVTMMPQPFDGNRPYTGYATQYTMSEGYPETPMGDTFTATNSQPPSSHRPQPSTAAYTNNTFGVQTAYTASSGDGSSSHGGPSSGSRPPPGAPAGTSVSGEKGAQLYTGPTVRNEPGDQGLEAPPSYSR